jgi:short-subunit dehydrogenase
MMNAFSAQHVWIIGASSGIGEALARELVSQGAHVTVSARSADKLAALQDDLGDACDVAPVDAADAQSLVKAAQSFEKLDSVIFMAALYAPHSSKTKEIGFIHDMIKVNLGGAFNTVNAVMPLFDKQGCGQIVLCGSVAGYRGLPYGQPYCATKAAILNYAESLKVELEDRNIDVKVISPGFVKTPLTDKNDFPMPMMIEANDAAKALARGLLARGFEIHFPKRFTYIMKVIDVLPRWIYFPLARLMKRKQS